MSLTATRAPQAPPAENHRVPDDSVQGALPGAAAARDATNVAHVFQCSVNFLEKCRSFSAVSAPICASKYAFVSIFQNLPDFKTEIFEIWKNFANFATFAKFLLNFHENC